MDQLTKPSPSARRTPSAERIPGRIAVAAATLISIAAAGGVAQAATTWSVPLGANSKAQAQAGTLSAPTGVTSACIGNSGNKVPVQVSWTGSANATSYTVTQATTSNGTYSTVQAGITGTSYSFTPLVPGTYFYKVTANLGNWSSPMSAPTSRTTFVNGNCS